MPYRISRLGHVEIRSVDLDRDLDYYVNVLVRADKVIK